MSYAKIRPKRGTASQWENANPVLKEGELALEVPTEGVGKGRTKAKIGDGVTAWNGLPYAADVLADIDSATETVRQQMSKNYAALNGQLALKVDKSAVVNDCTTEAEGKVLDARQGTALAGDISALAGRISALEKMPYIICGSKSTTGNGTSATILFSQADVISKIKSTYGDTSSAVTGLTTGKVNVLVSNGDGNKQAAHVEGATCLNNNWYACWDKNVTSGSAVVVNYTIIADV